jgi:hypothetical protein
MTMDLDIIEIVVLRPPGVAIQLASAAVRCGKARTQFGVFATRMANGAPEEIRTPDPQIRSLGSTIGIIEVRSRKRNLFKAIRPAFELHYNGLLSGIPGSIGVIRRVLR